MYKVLIKYHAVNMVIIKNRILFSISIMKDAPVESYVLLLIYALNQHLILNIR